MFKPKKTSTKPQNPLKIEDFNVNPIFSSENIEQSEKSEQIQDIKIKAQLKNPLIPPSENYFIDDPSLTSEQIENIIRNPKAEKELYKKIRLLSTGPGTAIVVKSVRNDFANFWGSFLMGITEKQQLSKGFSLEEIRKPLRIRRLFKPVVKITSRGPVWWFNSPQFTKEQKYGTSKKQSATLVRLFKNRNNEQSKRNYTPPVFGWDKARAEALTGVIFFSRDIHNDPNLLISDVKKYDGGTYLRPGEFYLPWNSIIYSASKKYNPIYNPYGSIVTGPEQLFRETSDKEYNESLIRMRFTANDPRYQLGIFSNNLTSKLIAQFRAVDVKVNLDTKFVPISFYIENNIDGNQEKQLFEYTLQNQKEDLLEALNSSDPTLKAIGQCISIYNQDLDPRNINNDEKINILKLIDNDQITNVTKTELLKQIFGINLDLQLNVKEKAMISKLIVKDLLAYPGNILNENISQYYEKELLILASLHGDLEIVKMLIDKDFALNITDNNGQTALIHATKNKYVSIVKILLDKGADLNITDHDNKTALMYAIKNGNMSSVLKLFDKKNNINKTSLIMSTGINKLKKFCRRR